MPFFQKRVRGTTEGFGDALRELRELRGLTREDVSANTRIHPTIIRALEEERLSDLTDPVYAERHIVVIARSLDGQERYYVEKYRTLLLSRGIGLEKKPMMIHRLRNRDRIPTAWVIRLMVIVAICLGMIGLSLIEIRRLERAPVVELLRPSDGAQMDSPHVRVEGHVDPGSTVTVNGESAIVDDAGNFLATVDLPRGLSTVRIIAKKRYGAETTLERHVIFVDSVH